MSPADAAELPGGKMHFTRMDEGSDADYEVLKRVHEHNLEVLPDLLLGMLSDLDGDANYPINLLPAQPPDRDPGPCATAPTRSSSSVPCSTPRRAARTAQPR